jgi:arylsulfatase A-like enzyme/Tfp pilus assembly protein PilF
MKKRHRPQRPVPELTEKAPRRPSRRLVGLVAVAAAVVVIAAAGWALRGVVSRSGSAARPASSVHNALLITLDTTRADYLGCYGRTGARTPNLDRLAHEGAIFSACRTCAPLTLPSHASIMTGAYPYEHGARQNGVGRLVEGNRTIAEVLHDAGFRTQATVASFVLNRVFGVAQGFDVYHDVPAGESQDALHAERKGDDVANDAVGMLRSLAQQRFFLWVHFYDPHYPYQSPRGLDPGSPEAYEDEIAFMDSQIGRVLDTLRELGLEEQTLVVAVGDHGEGLGQHQEAGHGTFLYETTLHVPLIVRCPGTIPGGRTIATPVRTIDLAPTIVDLLGVPIWDGVQGASLAGLLHGEVAGRARPSYAETLDANALWGLSPLRSWTASDWKYILAPRAELYDLGSDPGEARDVSGEDPERAASWREQLRQLIAEAPPPPAGDASVKLSARDRTVLESLGYVGSRSQAAAEGASELDRFEPRGGDPKDFTRAFAKAALVSGAVAKGEYARAEALLRELVAALPDVPVLQAELSHAVLQQGRLDEALGIQERALGLAVQAHPQLAQVGRSVPKLARAQLELAAALQQARRTDETQRAFELTVELDPEYYEARQAFGSFLLGAGKFEPAVQQLLVAVKLMPDNIYTLHDLGTALVALERLDEAEPYLTRAVELAPQNAQLHHALGLLRWRQKRLPEAAEQFRQALELDPNSAQARAALQKLQKEMSP